MESLKFKTNINCDGCIAKVTPYINEVKGITKWSVDISDPMKILTIESTEVTPGEITGILKTAGYNAELIAGK